MCLFLLHAHIFARTNITTLYTEVQYFSKIIKKEHSKLDQWVLAHIGLFVMS